MRFFDEDTGGKQIKETLVLMAKDDVLSIREALEQYVNNNKRKVKAKKLLSDIDEHQSTRW